jgi:TM2 domain-containing membrane protein YozV
MIRCGSDQTYVKKGGRNVTIIGKIPPSFLYMCLIRTTSNHWSHSSLLSLHQTYVKKGGRNVTND